MNEQSPRSFSSRDMRGDPTTDYAHGPDSNRGMADGEPAILAKLAGLQSEQFYDAGVQIANLWLMALRLRETVFGNDLFADPAWDILLDLHSAEARNEKVKITSLSAMARVPSSTSCRWARILTQRGLIVREKDPMDKRRVYVRLSPHARQLMRLYFDSLLEKGSHHTVA